MFYTSRLVIRSRFWGLEAEHLTRQQKYQSSELELLGLKWAVTEHLRDYLVYAPVVDVYTDKNPLVYIFSTAKLNPTGQRWTN